MSDEADGKRVYWTSKDGQTVIYKERGNICGRSLYTLEHKGVQVMAPALFPVIQKYWREEFGELAAR